MDDIVLVDPVLGRAPDKRVLRPSRGRITFDRMTPRPDQIKQPGKLDDEPVVVVLSRRVPRVSA